MSNFLKFLKIIVGLPFFAIWAVLAALVGFVLNFIFTPSKNPKKEATKEDISKRKELYKRTSKTMVVDDLSQQIDASFNWEEYTGITSLDKKNRQKKKQLSKRRKRKKLAKKSRRQNRK
jgi:hypothetical protein